MSFILPLPRRSFAPSGNFHRVKSWANPEVSQRGRTSIVSSTVTIKVCFFLINVSFLLGRFPREFAAHRDPEISVTVNFY